MIVGMQSLLESERNRANDSEKKCTEALESSESKQLKLEETVNRANQLQESLTRYCYSYVHHSKSIFKM